MNRRKLVAGNWKMNGSLDALAELDAIAEAAARAGHVDVAICPPSTLIAAAAARAPGLAIGAQDCHPEASGAYTGWLSASMLTEAGAGYAIVGHSERRAGACEDDAVVRAKAEAAMRAGLVAIICVGESEAEREAGEHLARVATQIDGSVPPGPIGTEGSFAIAYEPIWAIGTGKTAVPGDVAEMHALIRERLRTRLGEAGEGVRILYGGSVKAANAAELFAVADVDGALVGGASLTARDFVPIIEAAEVAAAGARA